MKTLKLHLILSFLIAFAFSSCDVIEEPFMNIQEVVSDSCEAFIFTPVENPIKKVLLEDYTGHQCGNCPRAAEKAHELQEIYGEQLVVMSVHAGFFSTTSNSYPTNFQTEAGNEWDVNFGNSAAGNPNGHIDRVNYPNNHIYQYSQWGQIISEQLLNTPKASIQIHSEYNEHANLICVDTQSEILASIDHNLSLTVVLLESGIISKQTDYSALPNQYVEDYEHNHVLRTSLNGPWGENLGKESFEANEVFSNRYSITPDSIWDLNNMSIVAFLSNPETYEVVQVEEIHLTH